MPYTGTAGDTAKAIIPGDNFGGPEDVLEGVDIEKLFESEWPINRKATIG